MRVRALSPSGDYTFGRSQGNYLIDSPAAVGQHVLMAMRLLQGEWFLDTTAGMPWAQEVLGRGIVNFYDLVIQDYVLSLLGVSGIESYASQLDDVMRRLTVSMTIATIFSSPTGNTTEVNFAVPTA